MSFYILWTVYGSRVTSFLVSTILIRNNFLKTRWNMFDLVDGFRLTYNAVWTLNCNKLKSSVSWALTKMGITRSLDSKQWMIGQLTRTNISSPNSQIFDGIEYNIDCTMEISHNAGGAICWVIHLVDFIYLKFIHSVPLHYLFLDVKTSKKECLIHFIQI